jgi:hypothetical protein
VSEPDGPTTEGTEDTEEETPRIETDKGVRVSQHLLCGLGASVVHFLFLLQAAIMATARHREA